MVAPEMGFSAPPKMCPDSVTGVGVGLGVGVAGVGVGIAGVGVGAVRSGLSSLPQPTRPSNALSINVPAITLIPPMSALCHDAAIAKDDMKFPLSKLAVRSPSQLSQTTK